MNKICVLCEDPEYRKFLSELLTIFYLVTNIEFVQNPEQPTDADFLQVYKTNGLTEVVYTRDGEVKTYSFNDQDIVKNRTKTVKRILFRFLNEIWQSEPNMPSDNFFIFIPFFSSLFKNSSCCLLKA